MSQNLENSQSEDGSPQLDLIAVIAHILAIGRSPENSVPTPADFEEASRLVTALVLAIDQTMPELPDTTDNPGIVNPN